MSESRIQDWIRYVQERTENTPANAIVKERLSEATHARNSVPVQPARPERRSHNSATVSRSAKPFSTVAPARLTKPQAKTGQGNGTSATRTVARGAAQDHGLSRLTVESAAAESAAAESAAAESAAAGNDGQVKQRLRQRPETRDQLLERLTNPTISLYEASILLDVCSATVRRYTNSGLLPHERTDGGQRRFRLHDVISLMQELNARRK